MLVGMTFFLAGYFAATWSFTPGSSMGAAPKLFILDTAWEIWFLASRLITCFFLFSLFSALLSSFLTVSLALSSLCLSLSFCQ